jgi:hypothetical protein
VAQKAGSFEVALRPPGRLLVPATRRVSHLYVTIVSLHRTGATRILRTEIWHKQQKTLLEIVEMVVKIHYFVEWWEFSANNVTNQIFNIDKRDFINFKQMS